ncbi:hypothetical protein [Blastococcus sp. SYSU DS0619]
MTSPDVVLELRQAPLSQALYGASLVVGVVLLVVILTSGFPPLVTIFFIAFAGGITGYNTATALSRVRAHADGSLEVRNRLTTRHLQRSGIDRVMLGRQGGPGSLRRLELLLGDGTTLHLVATEAPPLPGLRRRLEQQAAELRAWLDGAA